MKGGLEISLQFLNPIPFLYKVSSHLIGLELISLNIDILE